MTRFLVAVACSCLSGCPTPTELGGETIPGTPSEDDGDALCLGGAAGVELSVSVDYASDDADSFAFDEIPCVAGEQGGALQP